MGSLSSKQVNKYPAVCSLVSALIWATTTNCPLMYKPKVCNIDNQFDMVWNFGFQIGSYFGFLFGQCVSVPLHKSDDHHLINKTTPIQKILSINSSWMATCYSIFLLLIGVFRWWVSFYCIPEFTIIKLLLPLFLNKSAQCRKILVHHFWLSDGYGIDFAFPFPIWEKCGSASRLEIR